MRRNFLILICCWVFALPAQALAAKTQSASLKSFQVFKQLPILENGRVKPIDTYAQNFLLRLSGKQSVNGEKAVDWFARFLFDPQSTKDDKIFLVNHPELAAGLGIQEDKKRRYSYSQFEAALEKLSKLYDQANAIQPKERDLVENEIIRLYENVKLYSELSLSFSFSRKHPDFAIKDQNNRRALSLPVDRSQFSYFDIVLQADQMYKLTENLDKIPENQWNDSQRELINVVANLFSWTMNYHDLPLKIIPAYEIKDDSWISPWDAFSQGIQMKQGRDELSALADMDRFYREGNQIEFDLACKRFQSLTNQRLEAKGHLPKHIDLEVFFNHLKPFLWAKIIYLLVFLLFLLSFMLTSRKFQQFVFGLLITGFVFHLTGLICRITILARPPVSNLYETFIFVGFISVASGILIEKFNKKWLGVVTASLSGYIFLTIAGRFANDGDTMQMLVAVLNSNFWLSTHVTSITIGYAGTCVAGIIGHVYMLQAVFKNKDKALLESTYKTLLGALGFGLTMTFLGTNLGGIWADQSWGRFWGWDPKENGALLIILWTALLFHLKVGKMIGSLGLAVGSVLGIIVVMWAWFGVNLLSIGLHSYGFTSGLATNLTIYVILQIIFIIIIYPLAKKKLN